MRDILIGIMVCVDGIYVGHGYEFTKSGSGLLDGCIVWESRI